MSCKKILVISVHPDDETLGCGGTILKHIDDNDEVYWLLVTNIKTEYGYEEKAVQEENLVINKVSKFYGFKKMYNLGIKPAGISYNDLPYLIHQISNVILEVKPEIVYSVNRSDIHTDHQIVAKAVMSCTKSFRYPFIKKILMYECLSETEISPQLPENIFIPNVYSDITKFIDKKIEALKFYETEILEDPMPRNAESVFALARYRGCSACVKYSEAFMLIRELI